MRIGAPPRYKGTLPSLRCYRATTCQPPGWRLCVARACLAREPAPASRFARVGAEHTAWVQNSGSFCLPHPAGTAPPTPPFLLAPSVVPRPRATPHGKPPPLLSIFNGAFRPHNIHHICNERAHFPCLNTFVPCFLRMRACSYARVCLLVCLPLQICGRQYAATGERFHQWHGRRGPRLAGVASC